MINKENLLKNRAAVQGNRSYIEQQVKTVAPARSDSSVIPDSPPRGKVSISDSKLAAFNIRDLKTNVISSSSSSSGLNVKRQLPTALPPPDSEDIRLENLRRQAAQKNFLKFGAVSNKPGVHQSSSSLNHSSNSLSAKIASGRQSFPATASSSSSSKESGGSRPTTLPMSDSQSVVATQVSKNRSVLDSLYKTKKDPVVDIPLKASLPAKPIERPSSSEFSVALCISTTSHTEGVLPPVSTSQSVPAAVVVKSAAPVTKVSEPPCSIASVEAVTVVEVVTPSLERSISLAREMTGPTTAVTSCASGGGNSLGSALDRFGKALKAAPISSMTSVSATVAETPESESFEDVDTSYPRSFRPARSSYPMDTVSDNFVRRNLKQRKFSYKKDRQASKPEPPRSGKYSSHPNDAFTDGAGLTNGDDGSDDEAMRVLQSGSTTGGTSGSGAVDVAAVGGGLSSWGLDPLALSLKAIEVQTELIAPSKDIPSSSAGIVGSSSTSSSASNASKATRGVRMAKILANVCMDAESTGVKKKVRGLDLDVEVKRKKEKRNATVLYGVQKLVKSGVKTASGAVVKGGEEVQSLLEQYAPKCPGHQMAAKLVTVKKPGANKVRLWRYGCHKKIMYRQGKQFYACTFPREQQCKFFMWAEDNPELISATVKANKTPGISGAASGRQPSASVPASLTGAEQWIVHAVQSYQVKLQSLSKSELRDEVIRCNRKNALVAGKKAVKLNVGGSVSELIERLSAEALRVLTVQCEPCDVSDSEENIRGNDDEMMELSDNGSDDDLVISNDTEEKEKVKVKVKTVSKKDFTSDSEESMDLSEAESSDSDDSSHRRSTQKKRSRPVRRRNATIDDCDDLMSDPEVPLSDDDRETVDELTTTLRRTFGFSSFREGQRWAMERSVAGRSSLLVLPTGSGKSLCYMLPSVLLPGLTIVVSPLLSLMNDQLKKLPVELPGACFSGGLTAQKAAYLCENILKGHIKILFISPERLCTPAFHRLMRLLKQQAQYKGAEAVEHVVSLLCLDEAHCLSQWSYNFRPAFLRIKREIRNIAPRAVLALTATASSAIQRDIMYHLGIDATDGLLALPSHRKNLLLSSCVCENENAKRASILKLVSQPIAELSPSEDLSGFARLNPSKRSKILPLTIVYVWRRDEADALGEYLQGSNVDTVVYHAGMDADARDKAQQKFDRGTVKCVVATVAFGMGVDKSDVRQIIHHSMPKAIENYVQEVGRAGRDGKTSACRMFCSREDVTRQHSLGNSNRVTSAQIVGLLLQVFKLLNPSETSATEVPFIDRVHTTVAVSVSAIENSLDISASSMETILSILELQPFNLLSVKGSYYDTIGGRFRVTDTKLRDLEQSDVLIRAILKLNQVEKKSKPKALSSSRSSAWSSGASYGLGLGNYDMGGSGSDDEGGVNGRGSGNTYGSAITDFSCSRLAVAQECDLTPEEVSSGMYSLQRRGLLEYTLTNSALYVNIAGSASGQISADNLLQMSTCSGFYAWLQEVSEGVSDVLNKITTLSGDRIINMWRVANTIASFSAVPIDSSAGNATVSDEVSDASRESVQEALQLFVSHAMDTEGVVENQSITLFESVLNHYQNNVPPAFMDNAPLSAISSTDKESAVLLTSKQVDLKRKLTSDILLMLRDPVLNELVDGIMSFALVDQLQKHNIVTKRGVRSELLSLYVCKVLHGLSSSLLPAGVWRNSTSWGRYRDFCYDDLLVAVKHLSINNVL